MENKINLAIQDVRRVGAEPPMKLSNFGLFVMDMDNWQNILFANSNVWIIENI